MHMVNKTMPMPSNQPVAFSTAGAPDIFLELFFYHNDTSLTEECKNSEETGLMSGETLDVDNVARLPNGTVTGDDVVLAVDVFDPAGNLRRSDVVNVAWDEKWLRDDPWREKKERLHTHRISCGKVTEGEWRLEVYKKNAKNPHK